MDVLEAIKQRRSIRQFMEQAIERKLLEQILDAARWAPTAGNQQRWRFIVVTDPTVKEMVRKVSPGIFATPAAFIVICAEKVPDASDWDEWTYLADCAIAAQNIQGLVAASPSRMAGLPSRRSSTSRTRSSLSWLSPWATRRRIPRRLPDYL
jgi:nitroreductase